jgi:hypothetical protein
MIDHLKSPPDVTSLTAPEMGTQLQGWSQQSPAFANFLANARPRLAKKVKPPILRKNQK